jgi:hypothetical protein
MENYQAIYDAVRSRFSSFGSSRLIQEIASQFDISMARSQITEEFRMVAVEHQRPSVLFRPKLSVDGNQWCALYGDNLQDGVAGFGDSPAKAMQDFDNNWLRDLPKNEQSNRKNEASG